MFPIVGFLAPQILGVVGFQIEIEKNNLWLEYLNLKGCHL